MYIPQNCFIGAVKHNHLFVVPRALSYQVTTPEFTVHGL